MRMRKPSSAVLRRIWCTRVQQSCSIRCAAISGPAPLLLAERVDGLVTSLPSVQCSSKFASPSLCGSVQVNLLEAAGDGRRRPRAFSRIVSLP